MWRMTTNKISLWRSYPSSYIKYRKQVHNFFLFFPFIRHPGCSAVRPAVNPVRLAPLILANAHQLWVALMAHWLARPALTPPLQEQVVWAAWADKAGAAVHCMAKHLTWAQTPRPPVRLRVFLCLLTPARGLRTSAAHLRGVKTPWAATAWPVYTLAPSPSTYPSHTTTGQRSHARAALNPHCLRGEFCVSCKSRVINLIKCRMK